MKRWFEKMKDPYDRYDWFNKHLDPDIFAIIMVSVFVGVSIAYFCG